MKIDVYHCNNCYCFLVNTELHATIAVAVSGVINFSSTSDLRDGTSAGAVITAEHLTFHYWRHS